MRYTPGEIKAKIKGFAEQKKIERHQVAWAVMHLMNATGNYKKQVTISDLTGEKLPTPERKRRPAGNLKAERDELKKRFGG